MDTPEQHFSAAKKIALTPAESARITGALRTFVQQHPVGAKHRSIVGTFASFFSSFHVRPITAAVVVVVLIAGTTVSYAADNALPGDLLYPVKVNLNERIAASLQFTSADRAIFIAERLQRRLQEADQLLASGKLTAGSRTQLQDNIADHVSKLEERVAVLADADPDLASMLSARVETDLRAHRAIFAMQAETDAQPELADMAVHIRKAEQVAIRARLRSDERLTASSYNDRELRAIRSIQTAIRHIEDARPTDLPETPLAARAQVSIQAAERSYADAQAKIFDGKFDDAAKLARRAQRRVGEARILLNVDGELKKRRGHDDAPASTAALSVQSVVGSDAASDDAALAVDALVQEDEDDEPLLSVPSSAGNRHGNDGKQGGLMNGLLR